MPLPLPKPLRQFVNHVRFMKNILIEDLRTKNKLKTYNPFLSEDELYLRKNGIVTIENFLSPGHCDQYRELIEEFASKFKTSTKLDNGTFIGFRTETSNDNADQGMIDISDIDKSIPIDPKLYTEKLEKIISNATGEKTKFWRLNAYINVGVSNTRDYHVDNFSANYKAFIYLADVPDESYGPYSFVKGSHHFYIPKYLNIYRNSWLMFLNKIGLSKQVRRIPDMIKFYNKNQVYHAIGKKGTLVISDQAGLHRGLPQEPNKKRVALIFNFTMVK